MKVITGKFNSAKVFTDNVEATAEKQIQILCDQAFVAGSVIRIMPDCHAGAGCTIGTTMTIGDKVVPNMVGVDIGCGMLVTELADKDIDCRALDSVIRERVPSGFNIRDSEHQFVAQLNWNKLHCSEVAGVKRARFSIGTLGGGNHFIEVAVDETGTNYLVIHSGSRNLGKKIAEYYQQRAFYEIKRKANQKIIDECKAAGNERNIQNRLDEFERGYLKSLAYVEGDTLQQYLDDMDFAQKYAALNRAAMAAEISEGMGWATAGQFTTIHNYIDLDNRLLRKGAVSAQLGERLLIPINMRDGSIIAIGKGNPDWNCSAPHGAGRIMSRSQAFRELKLEDYRAAMSGIYSTSVCRDTLDEAPFAYKSMAEIIENTSATISIEKIIRPLYNYKASGD